MDQRTVLFSLLLFSIPFFILLFKHNTKTQASRNLPPSPWKLPIIGNLHQLGSMPHRSLHDLSLKHGPLMLLQLGSVQTLIISSSEIIREISKSHDLAFSGRPSLYAAQKLSYDFSDMAFAPYGDYWRQVRKISILEVLSLKRVQSFQSVREHEVALLVTAIKRMASSSSMVNLSEMSLALSNNIVCRVMFGSKYGGGRYEERSKFHVALAETQELLGGFCVGDFFPRLKWVHGFTGLKKRLEKNFEELDGFYEQVIEEHLSKKRKQENDDDDDLVDVLLRVKKDPSYGSIFSSMNHIKGLIADLFIAGTDTSSATIVWTMTELVKNPSTMHKVQQELLTIIGEKTQVQETDLHQLQYLKFVIKESLRLHPPTPLLVPRETTETCIIEGYTIPAKTRVFINMRTISMDSKTWKDPERFWPERFLDSDVDFRGLHSEFIPFGFGRRGCPGMNFAVLQVELVLANLLHCFEWKLPSGMEIEDLDVEEAFGITMHKKNPLCLVAKYKV